MPPGGNAYVIVGITKRRFCFGRVCISIRFFLHVVGEERGLAAVRSTFPLSMLGKIRHVHPK